VSEVARDGQELFVQKCRSGSCWGFELRTGGRADILALQDSLGKALSGHQLTQLSQFARFN